MPGSGVTKTISTLPLLSGLLRLASAFCGRRDKASAWRIWENHPFSVMTDIYPVGDKSMSVMAQSILPEEKRNDTTLNMAVEPVNDLLEKDYATDQDSKYYRRGSLIFVRTHSGVTRHLRGPKSAVPVLVESTYYPASITGREISGAANIIAIAGGVGVTAVTPILLRHAGWHRLFWAVRSRPLVDQMAGSLGDYRFDRFNATIFQDQRMDISQVLRDEVLQRVGAEMTVVVSGPPKMADEVRVGVARLMRDYPAIKLDLVEESFSW